MYHAYQVGRVNRRSDLGDLPVIKIPDTFPKIWMTDNDVVRARSHFNDKQRHTWKLGINAFEAGEWDVAKARFNDVLRDSNGKDGPSQYLLKRMKMYNFCAPDSWQGYWT